MPQPSHSDDAMQADQGSRIVHVTISKDMVNALYSYFKGRNDVYTLRATRPNKKTGKYGYYTQCWNLCPKKSGVKISCGECKNRNYKQLKDNKVTGTSVEKTTNADLLAKI